MKYILKESSKEIIGLMIPFLVLALVGTKSLWVERILGDISVSLLLIAFGVLSYLFFGKKEGLINQKLKRLNSRIKYYSGGRIPWLGYRKVWISLFWYREVWEALFWFLLFCFAFIAIFLLTCWVYYKLKELGSIPLFVMSGYLCSILILLTVKVRREIESEFYYS